MSDREVNGFLFSGEKQYRDALKEAESISYIRAKAPLKDPSAALQVYSRLIADNDFHTPVGLSFLSRLREYIISSGIIKAEELPPIPVYGAGLSSEASPSQTDGSPTADKSSDSYSRNSAAEAYIYRLKRCRLIIGALIMIIIAIFSIALYRGSFSNTDEEIALQNKYAEWAESLEAREAALEAAKGE